MNILKALVIGPLCGLFFCLPAQAQKTKAQINTEITTLFPDNTVGQITPLGLRTVASDIANSIMPTAPVVSGNLACWSGTTGLLQDCGSAPATVPLVVGTTPVNSGTTARILFDNGGVLGEYQISGTGNVCMTTSCALVTPDIGTPTAGVGTNFTGTASGLTAGNVTTNANLTGVITSVGNATSIASQTGTGTKFVVDTSPALAGTPTAPTAAAGTNTTQIATTAAIVAERSAAKTLTNTTLNSAGTGNVLQVSGVTVSAGQYPGEPSTGSATAGNVGEVISCSATSGSPVSLTTGTAVNICSMSLTAGDWTVWGNIYFGPASTTSITTLIASISQTTGVLDETTLGAANNFRSAAFVPGTGGTTNVLVGALQISLSGTTTIFLVTQANFTVATLSGFGKMLARRAR